MLADIWNSHICRSHAFFSLPAVSCSPIPIHRISDLREVAHPIICREAERYTPCTVAQNSDVMVHHSGVSQPVPNQRVKHNYFAHNSVTSTNDTLDTVVLQNKTKNKQNPHGKSDTTIWLMRVQHMKRRTYISTFGKDERHNRIQMHVRLTYFLLPLPMCSRGSVSLLYGCKMRNKKLHPIWR